MEGSFSSSEPVGWPRGKGADSGVVQGRELAWRTWHSFQPVRVNSCSLPISCSGHSRLTLPERNMTSPGARLLLRLDPGP